jgi:hypothetical protein
MFAEDLSLFTDTAGFGVLATLAGVSRQVIFDAPSTADFDGHVLDEPSALVATSASPAVAQTLILSSGDLPSQLAHLAGTYAVRQVLAEPPDGAFSRLVLARTA